MTKREDFVNAIAGLEAQRPNLGDAVVDAAVAPLQAQLQALDQGKRSEADSPARQ